MNIAVLLSGGVDSSVALALLRQQGGHNLTAFYLKIWLEDELAGIGDCPWEDDLRYARQVCEMLGVPLQVLPLQTEYYERVVSYAIAELKQGRTPSPDIFCNQRIKFGAFRDAIGAGFDKIASGHYARIRVAQGVHQLLRAPDPVKDQTYFLSHLNQEQVQRALFPIGHLRKSEVRELARELNLPNKDRKDSQGICFLGKIQYPEFVRFHLGEKTGHIVDIDTGEKLGEHRGFWYYTIGQRQGLGLGNGPWFVVGKDTEKNIVLVAHASRLRNKARDSFEVGRVNWIGGLPEKQELQLKVRHGPEMTDCQLTPLDNGRWHVHMAQPDSGIARGQFAVFYDGEVCLGGGVIER